MSFFDTILVLGVVAGLGWWIMRSSGTPLSINALFRFISDNAGATQTRVPGERVPFRPIPSKNIRSPTPPAGRKPSTAAHRRSPFVRGRLTVNSSAPCWLCGQPRWQCAGH